MKHLVIIFFFGSLASTFAQSDGSGRARTRDFPLIVTLQFHGFTMPFRDFKANLRHPGIGIGTEVSLNERNLVQQISLLWYHNREVGDGLSLYSQLVYRPAMERWFGEVKGGIGYLYSWRPSTAYQMTPSGWDTAGKKGKGMLVIPIGVSAGYLANAGTATFLSYQFALLSGYSSTLPIVPNTWLQAGTIYHPKR